MDIRATGTRVRLTAAGREHARRVPQQCGFDNEGTVQADRGDTVWVFFDGRSEGLSPMLVNIGWLEEV